MIAVDGLKSHKFHWQLITSLLIIGFFSAVAVRMAIGGNNVSKSASAGLIFAGCLIILSLVSGFTVKISRKIVLFGLAGGVFLCIPVLLSNHFLNSGHPQGNYLGWAIVVSVVAMAEELFLRGVLFDAISKHQSQNWAIIIGAILFAVLHIPLYGLHAVPLDLAVGLWLGGLRVVSGSWLAPGIAHTLVDLISWWL